MTEYLKVVEKSLQKDEVSVNENETKENTPLLGELKKIADNINRCIKNNLKWFNLNTLDAMISWFTKVINKEIEIKIEKWNDNLASLIDVSEKFHTQVGDSYWKGATWAEELKWNVAMQNNTLKGDGDNGINFNLRG